jgi:hypothetical protein
VPAAGQPSAKNMGHQLINESFNLFVLLIIGKNVQQ